VKKIAQWSDPHVLPVKRLAALVGLLVLVGSAGAAGTSGSALSFKAARDFDTSAKAAQAVAVADLNGDRKLDLVAAHGSDDGDLRGLRLVSVLMGRGDGRFKPSHAYPTGRPGDELGAWSIAVGDVTGDGKPDIATGNPGAKSVSVLVNSGRGAFEPPANYPLNREPWDIAIADLNTDGKLDVATANPSRSPSCSTEATARSVTKSTTRPGGTRGGSPSETSTATASPTLSRRTTTGARSACSSIAVAAASEPMSTTRPGPVPGRSRWVT
jgi:hypothetical protein